MNLPNILTIIRLLMVPLFIVAFFNYGFFIAAVIFILACITDVLDGIIARKYNLITNFGTIMDPLADKLMQFSAFLCLFISGKIHLWVVAVVFFKEFIMALGALVLYRKKIIVPAKNPGKISTIITSFAVVLILIFDKFVLTLSIIAVLSTLLALLYYIFNFKKVYKE